MRKLSHRLLTMFAIIVGLGTVATGLTLAVRYQPYGVPDHRRDEYEQKIADIQTRNQLLKETSPDENPVAVVPEKTHNFGMLDPHTTAKHSFEIRNEGAHPLAVEVQGTSCKCTVGELADGLLEPGEKTEITLTWNTGYKAEDYVQTATVITNDPLQREIRLTVRGEIRAEFIVPQQFALQTSDRAELTEGSFVVYSQLWEDFVVSDVQCELSSFQWSAEPLSPEDPALIDTDARSAWRITVLAASDRYGKYSSNVKIVARPATGSEEVQRELVVSGKVRAPIGFYGPNIHMTEGLDIGTLPAGKLHQFHLVVRARDTNDRDVQVLDVKPNELNATLEPIESQPGSYRLSINVPANCPAVTFNADHQHGYVQVGDPADTTFSNWFPLYGAVATSK